MHTHFGAKRERGDRWKDIIKVDHEGYFMMEGSG